MNRLRLFLFFSFTSLLLFSQAVFAQKEVPELWNARVHDEAKVLSQATIDNLEHTLKVFEDSTSNQMAILIVPSLDGRSSNNMRCVWRRNGSLVQKTGIMES